MRIIGVTGKIASGKNLISFYLKSLKYPIFDADAVVHYLYEHDRLLIEKVSERFPMAICEGKVDRKKLSLYLVDSYDNWCVLEDIVHPVIIKKIDEFILQHRRQHFTNIVLNIPLLFEIEADRLCDMIIVADVHHSLSLSRIAKRDSCNPKLTEIILKKQNKRKYCHSTMINNNRSITIKTGLAKWQVGNELFRTILN